MQKVFGLSRHHALLLLLLAVAGALVIVGGIVTETVRPVITVTLLGVFVSIAVVDVRTSIVAVLVYLILLGDIRKWLSAQFGGAGADVLLVLGGVFALIICANAFAKQQIKFNTAMSKWVLALMAVMVLQIFNPGQGSLMAGVVGAMFVLVPFMWYWVGRTYANEAFLEIVLFRVVVPLGVLAAAYGIYHALYGYLPHQQLWLEENWFAGLGSPDNPAPISFFSNNQEHGTFLTIATVLCWAAFLKGRRTYILLLPVFFTALVLTGSRGPVVFSLLGMCTMWAAMGKDPRTWVLRGGVAVLIGVTGLVWTLNQTASWELDDSVQQRIGRQTQELDLSQRQPGEYSSIANHAYMMVRGYTSVVNYPLGRGIGFTTLAAHRYGSGGYSTETEFGDSFLGLGIPGGIAYHAVIFLVIIYTVRLWLKTRSFIALALVGLFASTMAGAVGGQLYAVSSIVIFCIGALDRLHRDQVRRPQEMSERAQAARQEA